ncbi:hypothetical protein Q6348_05780 [Isoptericola sp. b441]|uniref:Uncharacterized protein n=1 Tax=Actinotalea lenta TaxID=3064654 RepID=A0ABT9D841_9CELL|nr:MULTISPECIES: hypothetical protein [unclassified Isoptericola]MDO8106705.1 hypothetical protein [Isoptericola sp. b441]MDO8121583.1 hypothetical protein [Isoptericola sp. b490]
MTTRHRAALLALAGAAALAGLDAALVRLGAIAPVASVPLGEVHGVLMVYGFLGTAIALERAVALRSGGGRRDAWGYAAPAASGAGTVLALAEVAGLGGGRALPGVAWTASMALFAGIYAAVWRRQPSAAVLIQGLGAVAGLGGAALWTHGVENARIVPWWGALLVLTVVGERLELARLAFLTTGTEARIVTEACAVLVGAVATLVAPGPGYPLLGLALAVLVADVAVHDVARRTIRASGVARLMAACMLAGYGWAMVSAAVWVVGGPAWAGYRYDTAVHALTIGFALSMVVAHAPVIVPAVARRPLPYHPVMWVAAGLLHLGLLVRVLAGARAAEDAWRLGGTLGVVAVLVLVGSVVALLARTPGGRAARGRAVPSPVPPAEPEPQVAGR